ncbi:hypothetical protein V6N13_038071 [Hibiscus sabdariffa]|uniref:Deoxyhypusine synthase n=1 Tax=Hibiscus sabdariffa TaxID=183260 RepID=A0ABR2S417_9ROSI
MDDKLITVHSTVFKDSDSLEGTCTRIEGYDFNEGVNYSRLLKSMLSTGFQASNLGEAIQIVNHMLDWRLSDETIAADSSEEEKDPAYRESVRSKVFLGFTSNLISSGVRDTVRYLTEHHMHVPLDLSSVAFEIILGRCNSNYNWWHRRRSYIKCLAPTYKGDFSLPGAQLRSRGLNRIGNLLVPNDNYCKFEDWIIPIFDQMLKEQLEEPGLIIDVVQDIRAMNGEAVHASPRKTGMIILGGGLPKHHICNANMMRNGADYAVYINTAQEYDGSDSGAHPDEAVSWGKIRGSAKIVKVHCDATIAFPLLVAETFASRSKNFILRR